MTPWDEYTRLRAELEGLTAKEEADIAEANAAFQRLSRELDNELSASHREIESLRRRNTELQPTMRALCRSLRVQPREPSWAEPLRGAALTEVMRSAEYDVKQLQGVLSSIESVPPPVRPAQAPAPAPISTPPPVLPAEPPPPSGQPLILRTEPRNLQIAAGVLALAVTALALALFVL